MQRKAEVERNTLETQFELPSTWMAAVNPGWITGLPFLEHMLDQVARHGMIDMDIAAKGDLHIDGHHTTEDIGIALGQAMASAVGIRAVFAATDMRIFRWTRRLSRVVVDFSGRPGLEFNVEFPRAQIGGFDTELFEFFRGFVNHAGVTLHADTLKGRNAHHIAETLFQAFGRALRMALEPIRMSGILPSTKGKL